MFMYHTDSRSLSRGSKCHISAAKLRKKSKLPNFCAVNCTGITGFMVSRYHWYHDWIKCSVRPSRYGRGYDNRWPRRYVGSELAHFLLNLLWFLLPLGCDYRLLQTVLTAPFQSEGGPKMICRLALQIGVSFSLSSGHYSAPP